MKYSPLTIALLIETDGPGGAETMFLELASGLKARGHKVITFGPRDGEGWLSAKLSERGIPRVEYVSYRTIDPRWFLQLRAPLRQHGVDMVHCHEFTMSVFGAIAARMLGIPSIITLHGGDYYAQEWKRKYAMRFAARSSYALVPVSGALSERAREVLGGNRINYETVRNGVAIRCGVREKLRSELGVAPHENLVVAVGSLYPVKGHEFLIRALGELRSRGVNNWKAAIVGRGELEEHLRGVAGDVAVADKVSLLGLRDDVGDVLAAADIFTMPSLSEGVPLALLEAMFAKLPIIASDVGGIPEVISSGTEALLIPSQSVHELADALGKLIHSPALCRSLGDAAYSRAAREHGIDAMIDKYERLYRAAIVGKRP